MHSFLRNTAEKILNQSHSLRDLVVVLPNRRAGLFFARHLGDLIQSPTWMPEVKTIEDVFYEFAEKRPADDLTLIFELYQAYRDLHPEPEAFDRFYFWGELILKDFNDVDQFMADPEKLYHHLAEIKELETDLDFLTESQVQLIRQFWQSFISQDRKHQEHFLRFWQLLKPLYQAFQTSLEVSGLAYSGKLYRQVSENLTDIQKPEKKYLFVGFNAFTKTEEKLIKHFLTEFGAEIEWDIDAYYTADINQEAGMFFRSYRKDAVFGPTFPEELPEMIQGKKPKIKTYASPLNVNQANLVGSLLEQIPANENLEETVVILPDETLLFPVLHTLPERIDQVNVTMGYPVKNAPVYAFLEAVLEMQRYIKAENGREYFYHQPIKNLLSSTYLKRVNKKFCIETLDDIQALNKVYIPREELIGGGKFFELIFQKLEANRLFSYLGTLMQELAGLLGEDQLQRNYLFQCFKQLTRLRESFDQQGHLEVDREFFIRLFRQVFREVKVPFDGEPLRGLQIMGVLESRNLDFRRVIICNMNEDSFPPSGGMNSMIPFTIRKAFGLPVQEQNDAIYAYTFYRLLHAAEEIHMIYTTAGDQGKAGEKSRYIQQMEVELNQEMEEEVVFVPVDQKSTVPIRIEKVPDILQTLERYLIGPDGKSQTAFSPSALNTYLDCRLKFYFQYIAAIIEKEEVSEEIDAGVFGNLAHLSLENLYLDFIQRRGRNEIDKTDIEGLRKNWIFPAVEKAIRTQYHLEDEADTKLNGQMAIARDVIQRYVDQVLEYDASTAPFRLISLEKGKKYETALEFETGQGPRKAALRGIIDRVDEHHGVIRLIDYKSGGDEKKFPNLDSLFNRGLERRNKAVMQTLFYGLIYQGTHPKNTAPLKPAIFNLKEIFKEDFDPYLYEKEGRNPAIEVQDYREFDMEFQEKLKEVFSELYNPSIPFDQTEILKKCEYCPYKEICGR